MPRKPTQDDVDNDHLTVSEMADKLGLSGDERERYVHRHMTGMGHAAQRTYVPGDDDDDDRRSRRGTRTDNTRGNTGNRRNRNDDDDWF